MKKSISIIALVLTLVIGVHVSTSHAAPFNLSGWAWSSGTGWLSFNSTNASAGGPISGLVALYGFDSDNAADSSGNVYNGTLVGSPTFTTGSVGSRALVTNGSSQYISLPNIPTFTSMSEVTLSAWVKLDAIPTTTYKREHVIAVDYKYRLSISNTGKVYCAFNASPGGWQFCGTQGSTILVPGTWYHIAVTYKPGSGYRLYVNGALDGSNVWQFSGPLGTATGIPCIAYGCNTITADSFDGAIDDARIYNRALTDAEILQLYQKSVGAAYSVQVATTTSQTVGLFSGYAWSPTIGWLSFNASDVAGCPASEALYDKPSAQGGVGTDLPSGVTDICRPRVDLFAGKVSGWARILSMKAEDSTTGWLHLSGTNHRSGSGGVTYNPSNGAFSGFAWEPSAVGWIDFAAGSPTYGTVICRVGIDPNCPIVFGTISATCTASPSNPVSPGTSVTFTATPSGGTSPYSYKWNGGDLGSSNTLAVPFTASGFGPTVAVSSGSLTSATITCPNVVVTEAPGPSSGLKLLIGTWTADLPSSDYNDTGTLYKSLRVVSGESFKLQWNIDLASEFDLCEPVSSSGFSGFEPSAESGSSILSTSGVPTGEYNFSITCSKDGSGMKTSSVKLYIVSSTVEEF